MDGWRKKMQGFSKESLEVLREKIDLVEVLSSHIKMQKAGAYYKGLCPFHEEKSPSFVVALGSNHYHCYGCGAHGDAIQFLMNYLGMGFTESVKVLAEKFGVTLEQEKGEAGFSKQFLKEPMEEAMGFYHFTLLHTKEGEACLRYLYERGIDLEFIQKFHLGYAPPGNLLQQYLKDRFSKEILEKVGLIKRLHSGKIADFFTERMMIPILDGLGNPIGFSARKVKEGTFGAKYVNSPETPLFKKSKVLFALFYSRKRIAKERKALIVEGQIDAFRLIQEGFDFTISSQGTAFTEEQGKELLGLGVDKVYIAFDPDEAGLHATDKTGNFFQKEGVEVQVVLFPKGYDPDFILREKGPEEMKHFLQQSSDFLTFLVEQEKKRYNLNSPAQKTELVQIIAKKIRSWDHPLMVHESLRKLAKLTQTPEALLHLETPGEKIFFPKAAEIAKESASKIDPDLILESDFIRWLFLLGEEKPYLIEIAKKNLQESHFKNTECLQLYKTYLDLYEQKKPLDILSLRAALEEKSLQDCLAKLLEKKVNPSRVEETFLQTIQKMLDRSWMEEREKIKIKIFEGKCSEEEIMQLAKKFDLLKKERPQILKNP